MPLRARTRSSCTAPAKLTHEPARPGVRPDGYHLLDAEMVVARPGRHPRGGRPGRPRAIEPSRSSARPAARSRWPLAHNLVPGRWPWPVRPAARAGDQARSRPGAGLGGGLVRRRRRAALGRVDDLEAGRPAGRRRARSAWSGGRARVRGIGELVEPLPFEEPHVHAAHAALRLLDAAVYRRWDELGGPTRPAPANDLEPRRRRRSSPGWSSGATAWATPPGSSPGWPAAARPGSSRASFPGHERRRGPDGPRRIVRRPGGSRRRVGEATPVLDAELLGSGLGRDAGRGEGVGGDRRRPASGAASCGAGRTRLRTSAKSRVGSASTAGRRGGARSHEHRLDLGLGQEHRRRHPTRPPRRWPSSATFTDGMP